MNVFVLNTGRCGSTTFIKACQHISNYTCAHESRSHLLGSERLNFPKNHIEADNRLSWILGRLDETYGDNGIYIHLKRNVDDTSKSLIQRYSRGIIYAYRKSILLDLPSDADPKQVTGDYCLTIDSNIKYFLKDKTYKIEVNIETIQDDFIKAWKLIEAEGDLNSALDEFNTRHNPTKKKQKQNFLTVALRKLKRIVFKTPKFIKDA